MALACLLLQLAVTRALPYVKPKLVHQFHDREDLIRTILTSCHVPYWLDGQWVIGAHTAQDPCLKRTC